MTDDFAALQARHLMQCWSAQRDYAPIAVDFAEGCWIHTTDGRRIFDLRSAHECINLGFRHPKVLAAMRAQMDKVVYVTDDFATEPTARLARRLAELAPGSPDKRVYFSQSGAAAIEAAIKGARQHRYVAALGRATRAHRRAAAVSVSVQDHLALPLVARRDRRRSVGERRSAPLVPGAARRCPASCSRRMPTRTGRPSAKARAATQANLAYLDYLIEQEGGNNKVAAMLVETVVGSNGIIPPPEGYLPGLRALCDRWGILLIVDETMTGHGPHRPDVRVRALRDRARHHRARQGARRLLPDGGDDLLGEGRAHVRRPHLRPRPELFRPRARRRGRAREHRRAARRRIARAHARARRRTSARKLGALARASPLRRRRPRHRSLLDARARARPRDAASRCAARPRSTSGRSSRRSPSTCSASATSTCLPTSSASGSCRRSSSPATSSTGCARRSTTRSRSPTGCSARQDPRPA